MFALPPLRLLDLPDEVLVLIFSFLDFTSLQDVFLVSKHIYHLAEPFLYKEVRISNSEQATSFSMSLNANKSRVLWIRSLLVSTKLGEERGLTCLPPHIASMRNLKNLRLETPDCNQKNPEDRVEWISLQDRYERVFASASLGLPTAAVRCLPSLEKCTLHFVDTHKEIYSMTRYGMLFLHPNLKSLTMSCASTDLPSKLLVPFQDDPRIVKSTALQYLHLEECDLYCPTLEILLRFPKELRALKISEGIRYDGIFNSANSRMHGNVEPDQFIDAIASQCKESLEYLSLSLGHFRTTGQHINHIGQHLNLTMFENLKYLELDRRTTHLIRSRNQCDHETWRRLPPNLETLKIFGLPLGQRQPFQAFPRAYFPLDSCLVKEKAKHGVPKLKCLFYSYEHYIHDENEDGSRAARRRSSMFDFAFFGAARQPTQVQVAWRQLVEACEIRAGMYRQEGVRLIIENVTLPIGFIPPYLYWEEPPARWILWDSQRGSCPGPYPDSMIDQFEKRWN